MARLKWQKRVVLPIEDTGFGRVGEAYSFWVFEKRPRKKPTP